jgi:LuxR family transcriptional regulator, maltose regulon positive regulatory protein
VVRSKLIPTQIPDGLLVRERVLTLLATDARFTLVAAMPGYGKTVSVRQWIDRIDVPVAWLSLDLLDGEPLSFWSHVLLAIGSVLPGVDVEPSMLLAERGAEDSLFLASLVAELENAHQHVVLVIDGLAGQLDQSTLDGLAMLVERAGDTLQIVVTARSFPALPLARWRSIGWLNELRESDLRLTDDEALAIARRFDPNAYVPDAVTELNRRVEGWPIGLHMALLSKHSATSDGFPYEDSTTQTDRMLANYLVVDVLESMTDRERDVALSLSVVEWFDPDICRELVGADADEVVRQLLGRGVFLTVVDRRTGAMRFHAHFRELMEMELSWRDPARRIELHRRAAMIWRSRGDLMAAYRHLSAIGDSGKAHDILVGPALELVHRGDLTALHQFAHKLPMLRDVDDANLALDLAIVTYFADGTLASRRWCDRAASILKADADGSSPNGTLQDDLVLRLHDMRCAIALLEADLDGAIEGIEIHRQLVSKFRTVPVFEEQFPILAARVMLAARRIRDADEWIGHAERLAGPEIVTRVSVPTLRAWREWMFGRLDISMRLVEGALAWMDEHHIGAHHLAFDTLITGGWCRLSGGDIPEAERLARRARVDADILDCAWNHLQAGFLSARLALVTGDPLDALLIVEDLRSRVTFENCRPYTDRILGLEIESLAASGRNDDAVRIVADLQPGPRKQLLQARFGNPEEHDAEDLLRGRETWPVLEWQQAELVLASRRDRTWPSNELVALLSSCAETGWVLPFLGMGTQVERLLHLAPLEKLHPKLARTLAFLAPTSPSNMPIAHGVRLTSRELTLLELLPTHLSYNEIGERLYLSVNTIKTNLKNLYRKLDANTRAEAVEAARTAGLL